MNISIFGSSCTGKTSVAERLAKELDLPLRSCGEEIKKTAMALNVSIEKLPDEVHSVIDGETLGWVNAHADCLVEGRFLDFVLSPIHAGAIFIQLTATESVRCARMQKCGKLDFSLEDLRQIDKADQCFRERLYNGISKVEHFITVEGSLLSVTECVKQITLKVRTFAA